MRKLHKKIIISLLAILFSNAVFGEALAPKIEENIGPAIVSSFMGGFTTGLLGAAVLGNALVGSAAVLGVTMSGYATTFNPDSDKSFKLVKEVLNKEADIYHMTGDIELALGAGINALRNEDPGISDSEAVDALIEAIN